VKDSRNEDRCSCGSNLKCRVTDDKGVSWVVCVGIGCDKKWLLKREADKQLPTLKDIKQDWA